MSAKIESLYKVWIDQKETKRNNSSSDKDDVLSFEPTDLELDILSAEPTSTTDMICQLLVAVQIMPTQEICESQLGLGPESVIDNKLLKIFGRARLLHHARLIDNRSGEDGVFFDVVLDKVRARIESV